MSKQKAELHGIRIRKTAGDKVFDSINIVICILMLLLVLYPLYLIVICSVSDPDAIHMGKVFLRPVNPSWIGYKAVFEHSELWGSYLNAIFYTVVGSAVSVFVTIMAAYAMTTPKYLGKKFINLLIVFTMFFSGGLIPIFLNVKNLGLYNTRIVMILMNLVSVWNLMVARTYIESSIPRELYEAAVMDGADHFHYFFKCILPLSGTIIAVLSVYYGVARWNDYFTGLIMLRDRSKYPLQTILREVLASLTQSASADNFFSAYDDMSGVQEAYRKAEVAKYCCIVVSTGPAVVLYICMQKYFVKGVMIGSLKG